MFMPVKSFNPDIYVGEFTMSTILNKAGMNAFLLYLEGETVKKLNHAGKTNVKFLKYDSIESIIKNKKLYNKTFDKLVEQGFAKKLGDRYITLRRNKDKNVLKFDMSMLYTFFKNDPTSVNEMMYIQLFNIYYNKSRSQKERLLGISSHIQKKIEKRNQDKMVKSFHYHIINLENETEKGKLRYGSSPIFPLYYAKKSNKTKVTCNKKFEFNCYGRQTRNKYLFDNKLPSIVFMVKRYDETSFGDAKSVSIDCVIKRELVDDVVENFIDYDNRDKRFKLFRFQKNVNNFMKYFSTYKNTYHISEKGYFRHVNNVNNKPLFAVNV